MIRTKTIGAIVVCGLIGLGGWGCSDDDNGVCPPTCEEPVKPFTPVAGLGSGASVGVDWGDYDGDGDPDLAVGNREQNYLYTNDGTGRFTETAAFGSGRRSLVVWADTDGDKDLDLLVGNDGPNQLFVNQGNGVFDEMALPNAGETLGLACGDLDGDTDLDLVIFTDTGGHRVYINEGGNIFTPDTLITEQGYSALADVDGDLDLDIITSGYTGKVFKNNGSGSFTEFSTFGESYDKSTMSFADYDKDGDLDLVHGVEDGGGDAIPPLLVYGNDGNGNFSPVVWLALATLFSQPAWGDLDMDGDPDLVVVSLGLVDDRVVVYTNDGGAFSKLVLEGGHLDVSSPVENAAAAVGLADADNDGDLDIAIGRTRYVSEFVFEPAQNTLFVNSAK